MLTIQIITPIQRRKEIRVAKLENRSLVCIQLYSFLSPVSFQSNNSRCRTTDYVNVCTDNSDTEITRQTYIEFHK
jgi:hypothetical protein